MSIRIENTTAQRELHILEVVGNAIVGGMESFVVNLIRNLPTERYRVSVVCPFESPFTVALRQMGCAVFITPFGDDPHWASIQLTAQVVREHDVDVIHAHLPNGHVLAGIVGALTHTPTVATVHGLNLTNQELGISRTTGTDLTVVCQQTYMEAMALGVPAERLTLIPNGVDTATFTPGGSGERFRAPLGVPADAPLVGFVGRLNWEKGPDLFLRMAERVHRHQPHVHFCIVGEGPLAEGAVHMVGELGIGECVHLAGLWRNILEVYPAFDIFVQTSRSEGMPLALLEAMACGRPVVAMAVGGVTEVVEFGTSGLLVDAGDWEGLAIEVLQLLARPTRARELGEAARRRVEQNFNLKDTIRRTDELFQRLANSNLHLRAAAHAVEIERDAWRTG